MQATTSRAEALSSEWDLVEPIFCLGQRVTHGVKRYRGVVVGWDKACCESADWQERNQTSSLQKVRPRASRASRESTSLCESGDGMFGAENI